jgi:pimeloyl-ACP methyl ester carboxylesterase
MGAMSALSTHSLLVSDAERPPLILVHGAANSARVWTFWQDELARHGWSSHAIDLRGHGASGAADLSATRMADYAADVVSLARTLRRAPVLLGWSMGGLVAMMAATACEAPACVGLAPSTPSRTLDPAVPLRAGVFGPEEYGIIDRDPDHQPAMADLDRSERVVALDSLGPESRLARDERKAGVVVDVRCPLLIVTGTSDTLWPRHRYDALPLAADHVSIDGASHWGLVVNRRLLATIASVVTDWLGKALARGSGEIRPRR